MQKALALKIKSRPVHVAGLKGLVCSLRVVKMLCPMNRSPSRHGGFQLIIRERIPHFERNSCIAIAFLQLAYPMVPKSLS